MQKNKIAKDNKKDKGFTKDGFFYIADVPLLLNFRAKIKTIKDKKCQ